MELLFQDLRLRWVTSPSASSVSGSGSPLLVEVRLACRVLNTTTRLGMSDSYRVA